MNLYRVKLRGMQVAPNGVAYGDSYVLADDPTEAYKKVKTFLDDKDIGFTCDRELESIELLADDDRYNDIGKMVFM